GCWAQVDVRQDVLCTRSRLLLYKLPWWNGPAATPPPESAPMWKTLLALAVAAGILVGARFLYLHRHTLFRPDFDRAGGTLLFLAGEGQPSRDDLDAAADLLRRRFDPTGGLGILVAANDDGEVEFRVPRSDKHDALVDQVKRLVDRPGQIEVRVLAR